MTAAPCIWLLRSMPRPSLCFVRRSRPLGSDRWPIAPRSLKRRRRCHVVRVESTVKPAVLWNISAVGLGYQLLRYCRPSAGSDSNRTATFNQKKSTPVGRTFLKNVIGAYSAHSLPAQKMRLAPSPSRRSQTSVEASIASYALRTIVPSCRIKAKRMDCNLPSTQSTMS